MNKRKVGRPKKEETRELSEFEKRQIRLDSIKCKKVKTTARDMGITENKVYYARRKLKLPIKSDKKSIDKFARAAIDHLKKGTVPWKDIIYYGGYCEKAVIQHIRNKYPDEYERLYYLIRPITDLSEDTRSETLSKARTSYIEKKKREESARKFVEERKQRLHEGTLEAIKTGRVISQYLPSGLDNRGFPNRFELMNVIVGHDLQTSARLCGVSTNVLRDWLRELEIPMEMIGVHSREYEGLF